MIPMNIEQHSFFQFFFKKSAIVCDLFTQKQFNLFTKKQRLDNVSSTYITHAAASIALGTLAPITSHMAALQHSVGTTDRRLAAHRTQLIEFERQRRLAQRQCWCVVDARRWCCRWRGLGG